MNALSDLRAQDPAALKQLILEQRRELMNLRLRHRSKQLENFMEISRARRQIARLKTVLNSKMINRKEG
jgi:ribosomal protein L29